MANYTLNCVWGMWFILAEQIQGARCFKFWSAVMLNRPWPCSQSLAVDVSGPGYLVDQINSLRRFLSNLRGLPCLSRTTDQTVELVCPTERKVWKYQRKKREKETQECMSCKIIINYNFWWKIPDSLWTNCLGASPIGSMRLTNNISLTGLMIFLECL